MLMVTILLVCYLPLIVKWQVGSVAGPKMWFCLKWYHFGLLMVTVSIFVLDVLLPLNFSSSVGLKVDHGLLCLRYV